MNINSAAPSTISQAETSKMFSTVRLRHPLALHPVGISKDSPYGYGCQGDLGDSYQILIFGPGPD